MKRITLQDVAELAGVSTATVSRVVNNPEMVSDQTRIAVLSAMDRLGFDRPRLLQAGADTPVGVIVPELINPIFAEYAHELAVDLSQRDALAIIASQSPGAASEGAIVDALLAAGCRGLIFVSGRHADQRTDFKFYEELVERQIPIATINGPLSGVTSLYTDIAVGVKLAVRHLVDLGHTSIALVNGVHDLFPAKQASIGFNDEISACGLDSSVCREIETFYTREGGGQAALDAYNHGVSAIVCSSDQLAIGAMATLAIAGVNVPEDCSVIGVDGALAGADTHPALSTVKQPLAAICATAASAVITAIRMREQEGTCPTVRHTAFQPELIMRASTGRVPTIVK